MNRYQFFSLLESNMVEGGGGSRKSKMFRRQAAKGELAALPRRADLNDIAHNKQAFQRFADVTPKEDVAERGMRFVRTHGNAAIQDAEKFTRANPRKVAAGVGGVAALGLAAAKHMANRRAAAHAASWSGKAERVMQALKANPKKAALAGAAGLGGMMFLRKKNKDK